MRIVVSGGGTGGHIMPAIALAEALRKRRADTDVLFIGGVSGMETEIVPRYGIPFQAVTSKKLRKVISPGTIGVLLALFKGYREARTTIRAFRADAVVGTGGYAAAATVLAGAHLGVPTYIHEGNVLVGRTNRLLARYARKVGVTFAETVSAFPAGKAVLTGLPLREGIVLPPEVSPQEARCRFTGMAAERFTVLVIGGSQGARAVNTRVLDALPGLLDASVQVIHQTGPKNFEEVQAQATARSLDEREGYLPLAFLDAEQMPAALRAADLIVCRGGISTLSEALVNALPLLIIPLPTAYADHQTVNAQALERAGAAWNRSEATLSGAQLQADILTLRDDTAQRSRMAEASRAAGRPDAADRMAALVLEK